MYKNVAKKLLMHNTLKDMITIFCLYC